MAFTGARRDGSEVIVVVADDGTVTPVVDTSGQFARFMEIDLNDNGSVAFDAALNDGTFGVFRIDPPNGANPTLAKIIDSNGTGSGNFVQVSINDSGQVAYQFRDAEDIFSTVGIGNGRRFGVFGLGPVVLGPGSVAFGRTVSSAQIGRDALNNLGQVVMHVDFDDGSQMVVRADPFNPLNVVSTAGAFALSSGSGSGAGMGTTVNLPQNLQMLEFDATFLTNKGELKVLLGDKLLKSVAASSRGARQHMRVPIDLREKTRRTTPVKPQVLKFQLTGAPGAVVHIEGIQIPYSGVNLNADGPRGLWHFDTKGGGWAGVIDSTRFPVEIKVLSKEKQQGGEHEQAVSVAILSTASFDATKDIERETLHFAGKPVRRKHEAKESGHAECVGRDVNGDQRADLVCEFAPAASKPAATVRNRVSVLEGMTPYGWMIEGKSE